MSVSKSTTIFVKRTTIQSTVVFLEYIDQVAN